MTQPSWLAPTLELQNCDIEIRSLKQRIAAIPAEIDVFQKESQQWTDDVSVARKTLQSAELKLKQLESDAKVQEDSIQQLLTKSAMIKKQDDYNAAMSQLEFARQKRSDIETEELETMDAIESAQKALKAIETEAKARQSDITAEIADLETISAHSQEAVAGLEKQRETLKTKVPAEILSIYERILARNRGVPLNALVDGVCQSCHTKVTLQTLNDLKRGEMVHCSTCSAILYLK